MRLRWSDQAQFDLDWMYEGVFAACRDFDTTDRYCDGMIEPLRQNRFSQSQEQNYTWAIYGPGIIMSFIKNM